MHYFIGHRIVNGKDGFTVILYLDEHRSEFATELGDLQNEQKDTIHKSALEYIKEKFPKFKVNVVKVVLGSMLLSSFPIGGIGLAAEPIQNPVPEKATQTMTISNTSYTVVSGDTLYLIARRFNTTVSAIKQASNLTGDTIYVGQKLTIPGAATTTPAPAPAPITQNTTYKVVAGDSLYKIALQFKTTVSAIKQANNLTADTIYVGQALTIPGTTTTTPAPAPTTQNTTYKVVAGDSLYNISRQFNTTIDALKQANNLTGDAIYIGQTLTIPGTTTTTPTPPPVQQEQPALSIGAQGPAVENLQRNLQNLGFISGVTGMFDNNTAEAVRAFQGLYGLPITGAVDNTTQSVIDHALIKKAIATDAAKYTGTPYVWGGASPSGFDCSGFVHYMFNSHGLDMPRTTSRDLYKMGTPISRDQLQPGDLVFFAVNEPGVISHVGIYVGNNQFISATTSKGIWTTSLDNTFWAQYYVGAQQV
ncbi:MAG TPA: cell wall hydrolase [Paenibacillaceae bacterium]|nr:cell wall hydrolase [Paenibacillaceae bacterium]